MAAAAAAAAAAIRQSRVSVPSPTVGLIDGHIIAPPTRHRPEPHEFSRPSDFLGSWDPSSSSDPREAQKRLSLLRRYYEKQVSDLRKQYIYEMELERQDKLLKDEARREAIRLAKEERKRPPSPPSPSPAPPSARSSRTSSAKPY